MKKEKFVSSTLSFLKSDIIQEFFYSAIGCLFFILLYSLFPKQYWNVIFRKTIILILTLSFLFVFVILNQTDSRNNFFKVNYKRNLILFTIFNFAGYLFLFYNTHWGYNGLAGDNFYRTAYITQMAHSGYPQDFAYKGLSAFYAPFYWYCLALVAIIFQIPPYKMVRIGLLITCFIMPIILFEMWKKIYEEKISFVITIICSIYLINIYSPDHMIAALLFIPYFLYYFENCTNKEFTKKDYMIGGIIGSISFCTYFLYFLIIPIYFLLTLIQDSNKFKRNLKHRLYTIISLIIFSSWFWAPLLRDILLIGFESHQNRYFYPELLRYPVLYFLGVSISSIFSTIGLIYIIRKYKLDKDIKIFGNLLIAIHIGFYLGFIGIIINLPIMHERIMVISGYILMISSSIFYVKSFYFISKNEILKKNKIDRNFHQIEIFILISIMIIQLNSHWTYIQSTEGYEAAKGGNSMREIRDVFEELDYEDKVFLTSEWKVAMFLPIYVFLLPNPYYSHPSAQYNRRVEFLIELSKSDTSKEFYDKIINNEYGPIDYFYLDLEDNNTKLVLDVAAETYPHGREYFEIEFDVELFKDEDYFEEIIIDEKLIYRTKY